ncbi:zinc metalloprotease [Crossiella cryophila]
MLLLPGVTTTAQPTAADCLPGSGRSVGRDHADVPADKVRAVQAELTRRFGADGDVRLAAATINVYVHVVSKDTTLAGGDIPDKQIADQIKVLNTDFRNTPFQFVLAGTDRTVNPAWHLAKWDSPEDLAMRRALRKGSAADLNLWFNTSGGSRENLGYATFPWDAYRHPRIDGVVIQFDTVPGGTLAPYNLGRTATHEVGHWLGLLHTFQGTCDTPGDEVADTPYQASASEGCPEGRDSCPAPGADPIHNFMDYSDDACLTVFSSGQIKRMKMMAVTYRELG